MFLGVTYTPQTSTAAVTSAPVTYAAPGAVPAPIKSLFTYEAAPLEKIEAPIAQPVTSSSWFWIALGILGAGAAITIIKRRRAA